MKNINCIAIDDEPWALQVIAQFCKRKGNIELQTFTEPLIGLSEIKKSKPDLVFLDIEMNNKNGLEIAKTLPQNCCFIFTTAHAQYALDGFNLDAVDFLYKPFAYERFEKAVDKAIRRIDALQNQSPTQIVLNQEYTQIVIPIDDILYIEDMENYTKVFRNKGGFVLSRTSLKTIESMLPVDNFIRIHKSYIVPIWNVISYTHKQIQLQNFQVIPIGKTYLCKFLERIQKQ